jgi:predicted hydrolase (HD superfamily)
VVVDMVLQALQALQAVQALVMAIALLQCNGDSSQAVAPSRRKRRERSYFGKNRSQICGTLHT